MVANTMNDDLLEAELGICLFINVILFIMETRSKNSCLVTFLLNASKVVFLIY